MATPASLMQAPGYLARRLYQSYVATWTRQVDPVLTGPQFAVLVAVDEYPGADQGSLAAAVALDRSTMADIARRMEEKGLLQRVPDSTDGRRRLLHLTPSGKDALAQCNGAARALDEQLMAGLDDRECAQVMRMLERLSAHWAGLAAGDFPGPG